MRTCRNTNADCRRSGSAGGPCTVVSRPRDARPGTQRASAGRGASSSSRTDSGAASSAAGCGGGTVTGQPQPAQARSGISIFQQLGACSLETADTPRGLVVTIPAGDFRGRALQPMVAGRLARVAAVIAAHLGLKVEVDDNGDGNNSERAEAVRAALLTSGMRAAALSVRSTGNSRPVASNATASGRIEPARGDHDLRRCDRHDAPPGGCNGPEIYQSNQ
jgi:hypothetical protein